MSAEPRLLEVRRNVLKENDILASELRQRYRRAGVLTVSLVSGPGAGKTAFLERTLQLMRPDYQVAAQPRAPRLLRLGRRPSSGAPLGH